MRLEGKVAIVTGGTKGTSRATVEVFAKEGADVVIFDLDEQHMSEVVKEAESYGRKGIGERVDITRWEEIHAAVERTVRSFGRIDILAVVGIGRRHPLPEIEETVKAFGRIDLISRVDRARGPIPYYLHHHKEGSSQTLPHAEPQYNWMEEISEEDWDGTMTFNLKPAFLCCKAVVPHMKQQKKGTIVTLSSIGAETGASTSAFAYAAYAAARAGVIGFTHQLARELGPFGIRVNCVCSGALQNPNLSAGWLQAQELLISNPLRRLSEPEEQAKAVLFLVSDEASYVNGVTLDVNGGVYMR